MTEQERRIATAQTLMDRAGEALSVARREQSLSPNASLNRAFYACFYAASAILLVDGQHFVKHSGVRAAVHRDLVRPGRLAPELGQVYDELYNDRGEADYLPSASFTPDDAAAALSKADRFVNAIRELLAPGPA